MSTAFSSTMTDQKVRLLMRKLSASSAPEEALDEAVAAAASEIASGVNNEGRESQVRFLLEQGWKPDDILGPQGADVASRADRPEWAVDLKSMEGFYVSEWLANRPEPAVIPPPPDNYSPKPPGVGKDGRPVDEKRSRAVTSRRLAKARDRNLAFFRSEILPHVWDLFSPEQKFDVAYNLRDEDLLRDSGYRYWLLPSEGRAAWVLSGHTKLETQAKELGAEVVEGMTPWSEEVKSTYPHPA